MSRRAGAGAVVLLLLACGGWRWHQLIEAQLPELIELPAGPRAPRIDAVLGLKIGRSSLAEVKAAAKALSCEDRSISTQFQSGMARAIELQQRQGENPWRLELYRWLNLHGRNPQVRWDCAVEKGAAFGIAEGFTDARVLFVLDAPALPLRHTTVQRTWWNEEAARADLDGSRIRLAEEFGAPTANGHVAELESGPLAEVTPYAWEWRWADLRAELNAVRYPDGRVVVTETIEVPWPVRSDRL